MFEINVDKLKEIDNWAPSQYLEYYTRLMPVLKKWYNVSEGYRPVVMGRNISWWLEMEETRRKCRCYKACPEEKDVNKDSIHMVLTQAYNDKMSCWTCEFNQKRLLSSGWERYYNIFSKILWTIDMVENRMGMLSTIRSMYWQPAIRDYALVDKPTDKSWNEITALNTVFDIDVIDKNNRSIFEKEIWDGVFDMLDDTGEVLENEDIGYKILFSGNGFYFITNKIVEKDEIEEGESREEFWNIISAGWANWINDAVKDMEEKHKNFTIDGREPYTMQFLKAPFSLHQRLDVSAIPTSIEIIGGLTSSEFAELCNPEYIVNNVDELLRSWR